MDDSFARFEHKPEHKNLSRLRVGEGFFTSDQYFRYNLIDVRFADAATCAALGRAMAKLRKSGIPAIPAIKPEKITFTDARLMASISEGERKGIHSFVANQFNQEGISFTDCHQFLKIPYYDRGIKTLVTIYALKQ